jgi:gliding motility-associated-like protein
LKEIKAKTIKIIIVKRTIAFICLSMIISINSFLIAQIPTNGLLNFYPFNGNANDESGNGNNGTVHGATLTTDRCGRSDSAYYFNGTDSYINIPIAGLTINQYTYALWALLISYPIADGDRETCISIGSLSGDQYINYGYFYTSLNVYNGWGCGGYNIGSRQFGMAQGITPEINQWYFLVATREANKMKLYINGILVATDSLPGIIHPYYGIGPIKAFIGERFNFTLPFHGKIDDIILYNRPLTETEILNLYETSCNNPISLGKINGSKEVCRGQKGVIYNVENMQDVTSYLWTYSGTGATINGSSANIFIDFANNATNGNLKVTGITTDGNETKVAVLSITVNSCDSVPPNQFNIPNSFSPNGDPLNEFFFIRGLMPNAKLIVFNRTGRVVYKSNNYQNNWDGKDNDGQILQSGTYWYVLSIQGLPTELKGFVYLKR